MIYNNHERHLYPLDDPVYIDHEKNMLKLLLCEMIEWQEVSQGDLGFIQRKGIGTYSEKKSGYGKIFVHIFRCDRHNRGIYEKRGQLGE